MQPNFYRVYFNSQYFCHGAVTQIFELAQQENRLIDLWEVVNNILNTVIHFIPLNLLFDHCLLFPLTFIWEIDLRFAVRRGRIRRIALDHPLK